jgi:hypothetical protein
MAKLSEIPEETKRPLLERADLADICVKRANAVRFVRQASCFPVNLQESNAPAVVEFLR